MTDIRFYHLTRSPLPRALPAILEKILERHQRAVVLAGSAERVEALNQALWTYSERSFLPHGSAEDGYADAQPVWLTDKDENPNRAEILLLCDGMQSMRLADYTLACDFFDGNDEDAIAAARARWKEYLGQGHKLTYWQQMEKGWEQKSA